MNSKIDDLLEAIKEINNPQDELTMSQLELIVDDVLESIVEQPKFNQFEGESVPFLEE